MPNVNPVLQAVQNSNAVASSAATAVSANSAKVSESYNADATLQRQNADSAALVESTKQAGQLQYEVALRKNALDVGTDIGDATGIYAALSKQYMESKVAQNKALDAVNEKNSVSFFDDPLQFVINQVTVNGDIQAHNAAEAKADIASKQISEMNLLTDQRAIASAKLKTTVTEASANAAVSEVRNKANMLADQYAREAILQNTAGIEKLVSLSETQLRNTQTAFSAQAQQEQIGIAQAHLAMSREEFNRKKIQAEKGDQFAQYMTDTVIRGYKAMYPNNPDKWVAPNSPRIFALISGGPVDEEMKYAYERGQINSRAANPDGSNRILATSAADFLQGMKFGVQTGADAKVVKDLIVDTARGVVGSAAFKQLNPKDVEGQQTMINDTVKQVLKGQAALVKDPSNPYYLPSIDAIAKQTPALQNFPLWKNILSPIAASGIDLSDPNTAFHIGLKAVQDGKISLNVFAVDLATMYKQGQAVNIQSKQFIPMGLAPENAYRVKIDAGGITNATVNMADPAEIMRAAMKYRTNTIQSLGLEYLPGAR